jgi:hypothetical protein
VAVSALGAYAGLLGALHGVLEILQGDVVPSGLLIEAVGPPCRAERVWHACLPALTVVPHLRLTGVLATVAGLAVVVWALAFVGRTRGGRVLMFLSLALFLVGGGFVPAFVGLVAGAAGTRIPVPVRRRTLRAGRLLARLWPWPLIVLGVWLPGAWLLGALLPRTMWVVSGVSFPLCDVGLPLLAALTASAFDSQR